MTSYDESLRFWFPDNKILLPCWFTIKTSIIIMKNLYIQIHVKFTVTDRTHTQIESCISNHTVNNRLKSIDLSKNIFYFRYTKKMICEFPTSYRNRCAKNRSYSLVFWILCKFFFSSSSSSLLQVLVRINQRRHTQ